MRCSSALGVLGLASFVGGEEFRNFPLSEKVLQALRNEFFDPD